MDINEVKDWVIKKHGFIYPVNSSPVYSARVVGYHENGSILITHDEGAETCLRPTHPYPWRQGDCSYLEYADKVMGVAPSMITNASAEEFARLNVGRLASFCGIVGKIVGFASETVAIEAPRGCPTPASPSDSYPRKITVLGITMLLLEHAPEVWLVNLPRISSCISTPTPTLDLSRYPHKCPICSSNACLLFSSVDCSNPTCINHR